MSWIDIGALDDIPLRGARVVKTRGGAIAVFRTAPEEVHATDDRSATRGGPLSDGIVHETRVTCPICSYVFDLTTGQAIGEEATVAVYPVRVEAGRVLLDSAALDHKSAA